MTDKNKIIVDYQKGLTTEQVNEQIEKGYKNIAQDKITKTKSQIITDNVFTLFNLLNFMIAVALALVGAFSNMIFILIIITNILIAIIQELHAKKLVDELSLLSAPSAMVVRNGVEQNIPVEDIVKDDVMILDSGKQICVDGVVLSGKAEINESLLTGESDPIPKDIGDTVLSGSSVISGKCYVQVTHVGNESYATKLAQETKKMRTVHSELVTSMQKVTKFTSFLIIPLGILLFVQAYFVRNNSIADAVVSSSAGLLGMLPKGLMLLISISLAVGVGKLAKAKVLVQELFSLETLAHVDVLCLDKTGTITEGKMKVESVYPLMQDIDYETVMGSFLTYSDDNNATFQALKEYFKQNDTYKPIDKVPFSSQRKWSAMKFSEEGTFVIGAPEKLTDKPLPEELANEIASGKRVLLAGFTSEEVSADKPLSNVVSCIGIVISDPVRANARKTMDYFRREGVQIKIISGDNPVTVSSIAKEAGVEDYASYIDMSRIDKDTNMDELVDKHSVFGRVSPEQKRQIVMSLKKKGHSVAMTGDGVNDLLALKEADCSIAIGEGSDAARQTAQLVLLNSDFSSLIQVLAEGRRVVNNITRVAGVFFIKTIYSVILAFLCVFGNFAFPFIPTQITLIDAAIEGYPAFFTSFEADNRKVKGKFLSTVLLRALPNALTIILAIIAVSCMWKQVGIPQEEVQTVMYFMVGFVSVLGVIKSSVPFNKLRVFLCVSMTVGYYAAIYLFHSLLHVTLPGKTSLTYIAILAVCAIVVERIISVIVNGIACKNEK